MPTKLGTVAAVIHGAVASALDGPSRLSDADLRALGEFLADEAEAIEMILAQEATHGK